MCTTVHILPTVQLRHTLPDGTWHIDWMLAMDMNDSPLRTFRLPAPLHVMPADTSMALESLPDHRRAYLEYEGPISGDRGEVKRIATGVWAVSQEAPDAWDVIWAELEGREKSAIQRITFITGRDGVPERVKCEGFHSFRPEDVAE
ncbi:MAG: hypothetical protein AAF432_04610 [Planctomycetota bacterium]